MFCSLNFTSNTFIHKHQEVGALSLDRSTISNHLSNPQDQPPADRISSRTNNPSKSSGDQEGKDWRNSLKHIANLVSYMMKTSSLLTNFTVLYSKHLTLTLDSKSAVKASTLKFCEDIFERHRCMVRLIKSNEDNHLASLQQLGDFARKVSEAGKEELACQEKYLAAVAAVINKPQED